MRCRRSRTPRRRWRCRGSRGASSSRDVTFGYDSHRPVLKKVSFVCEPGRDARPGRAQRRRQDDHHQPALPLLRCQRGRDPDRRDPAQADPHRGLAPADRHRAAGHLPLQRDGRREHRLRAPGREPGREIIRAAKIANAHTFIVKRPDGYESLVGEGGQGLSAGERQRLVIARAVLHNPRILILDEATSQVDVETEKQIQEAISHLVKGPHHLRDRPSPLDLAERRSSPG